MPSLLGHRRTFDERPNTRMEPFCMPQHAKWAESEWLERCESTGSAEQRVVYIIHVYGHQPMVLSVNKQRGKCPPMPSLLGHRRTFDERPNTRMEPFCMPQHAKWAESEWLERCESTGSAEQRGTAAIAAIPPFYRLLHDVGETEKRHFESESARSPMPQNSKATYQIWK